MGDADNLQILMPVEDVESMMGNALGGLESGLDGVLQLVNDLNKQTERLTSEVSTWRRVCRCTSTALNVLVLPVVLAFWVAIGRSELAALTPSAAVAESFIESAITLLMLISGSIGFPLYLHSMFQVHAAKNVPLNDFSSRVSSNDDEQTAIPRDLAGRAGEGVRESYDRLAEVARTVNRNIMDNVRRDLAKRINQAKEQPSWLVSINSERSEPSEIDDREPSLVQILDELHPYAAQDSGRGTCRSVRLIILDGSGDLAAEGLEKEGGSAPGDAAWLSRSFGL